jgi:hypothetical protein
MRVTKTAGNPNLNDLKALAMILNFDFEAGSPQELEELRQLSAWDFLNVESVLKKGGAEDRKIANGISAELRADLQPVIASEKKVSRTEAYRRIQKLLKKINEIRVKPAWGTEPVGSRGELAPDLVQRNAQDDSDFFNAKRIVEILGYKWFVGEYWGGDFVFSRDQLYLKIRDALQIGVFERLRICLHCKKFFVAEDARQQFCSDEHRNEYHNKDRLKSGYFKTRRSSKREADLARARKLLREAKSPEQIAKETGLSQRVLKREGVID